MTAASLVPIGIFYGSGADGTVFQHEAAAGNTEKALTFDARVATDYIAPSGEPVGESIMTALFVTISWDAPATIVVTPIVDDVIYDATAPFNLSLPFTLPSVTKRTSRTFLVPLYEVIYDPIDGVTPVGRVSLHGVWAGAIVETSGTFTGFLEIDEVNVEFERITESEAPAATSVSSPQDQ